MTARLEHPGICGIHDTGTANGVPYIAMRYIEGETVAERIASARRDADHGGAGVFAIDADRTAGTSPSVSTPRSRSMTRAQLNAILTFFEHAARALNVAHEAGVLHRDIKPGNIMIDRAGDPVILDFGLATQDSDDAATLTHTGDVVGTPAYMSPEQIAGTRSRLDGRSDVYSLGVTLYECLTLRRPFDAPTRDGLYQAIMTRSADDPRTFNRVIPADLAVVITCALEKDRDKRYRSAAALADDLAAVRESRPVAARPVGVVGRALRFAKRRPARAALASVLAIGIPLACGLGGYIRANLPTIEAQRRAAVAVEVESALEQGFFEHHHGDGATAKRLFERALELDPASTEAAAGLALWHIARNEPESALAVLDRTAATVHEPKALDGLRMDARRQAGRDTSGLESASRPIGTLSAIHAYVEGCRALSDGEKRSVHSIAGIEAFARAEECLRRAVFASPHARRAYWFQFAHATGHRESHGRPIEVVDAIRTLWPDSKTADRWCGFALAPTQPALAVDLLMEARKRAPEVTALRGWSIQCLLEVGRLDEALAEARDFVATWPRYADAHRRLALAHQHRGETAECVAALRVALACDPNDFLSMVALGSSLVKARNYDEAIDVFTRAESFAQLDRDRAVILYNKGVATLQKQDFKAAVGYLEKAMALNGASADIMVNLAVGYLALGREDDAIETLEQGIAKTPGDSGLLQTYGMMLLGRRRVDDAIVSLEKANAISPENPRILLPLGDAYIQAGRKDEALDAWTRGVEGKDFDPRGAFDIALKLRDNGRPEIGARAYERIIAGAPEYAEAWCNGGTCHARAGNLDEAWRHLLRGHAIGSARGEKWRYPSASWARNAAIAWVEELLDEDRTGDAINVLKETLLVMPGDTVLEARLEDLKDE